MKSSVGNVDGVEVGTTVGPAVDDTVGVAVGIFEGTTEGQAVGNSDVAAVCEREGQNDGPQKAKRMASTKDRATAESKAAEGETDGEHEG